MNDNISSDLDRKKELQDNNTKDNNLNKKRKHSQLEKNIIKLNYLSNLKIRKKYNCTKKIYEKSVINWLLNNANCQGNTPSKKVTKEYQNLQFIIKIIYYFFASQHFQILP